MISLHPLKLEYVEQDLYRFTFRSHRGDVVCDFAFRLNSMGARLAYCDSLEYANATAADCADTLIYRCVKNFDLARANYTGRSCPTVIDYLGEGPALVFNYQVGFSSVASKESMSVKVSRNDDSGEFILHSPLGEFRAVMGIDSSMFLVNPEADNAALMSAILSFDDARDFKTSADTPVFRLEMEYQG